MDIAGFVEFGEGEELIGIVGHLDVVPAKEEDWTYSPFVPVIDNNKIYGRGAIDDKGPVIASLYAMKFVMDYLNEKNIKFNKRVRLIVGLNEEKNWKCIEYYKEHEEIPKVGFSPDSDFPCIYAEKSVLSITISDKLSNLVPTIRNTLTIQGSPILINEIDCNNNAINVVPEFCSITLNTKNNLINNVIRSCSQIIKKYNYDIDLYKIDNEHLKLSSYGTASHSAHPELGVNSISRLIIVLNDLFKLFNISFPLFNDFCNLIGDDYTGERLNLNIKDESGSLTLNTSQLYIKDNKVYIGINLRIPVNTKPEYVIKTIQNKLKKDVTILRIQPALYINKYNPLVQKLCFVFNKQCKTNLSPIAIGGATYARAFDNFVCFGMNFPGDKDMCHQVDEFVDIDKMLLATNIYANAIYELGNFLDAS